MSADTEFLTPTGWKRIDRYVEGDLVAQFHPDTREIEFVTPLEYVRLPCEKMIAIEPARGTSQRLSPEHRVLYYDDNGQYDECSAEDFMRELHKRNASHLHRKFACTFSVRTDSELDLTDWQIRVCVAVCADGYIERERCTIRVKKARKVERLRTLLQASHIQFTERKCGGDPSFTVFRFTPPRVDKSFGSYWWGASQRQLEVVAAELPYWDSSEDKRPSNGTRFSTLDEASADFAQFAFAAAKRPTSITFAVRDRREQGRGVSIEYNVHAQRHDKFVGPGRKDSVRIVPNSEGYKYCFRTPSTYLLLRRNGYIFATGNTGKTAVQILHYASRPKPRGRWLIVCPKTLMVSAWGADIEKFAPELTVSFAFAENREEAFKMQTDVVVLNTDGVKIFKDKKFLAYLKDFDHLTIDEYTTFKHPTSQRSKAMAKLRSYFKYRYALSGTPNANSVMELWHPCLIVDDGQRLGTSYYGLRSKVQEPTQVGPSKNHLRWDDRPGMPQVIAELLRDITIRHQFEDVMQHVPANHRHTKTFELSKKAKAAYDKMENDLIIALEEDVVSAVHAASLRSKLLQIASGAVYNGGEEGAYNVVDSTRYELIADLIDEVEHSVVFFNWRHQRDLLCKEFDSRGYAFAVIDGSVDQRQRDAIVRSYQDGEYKTILLHPKTGAHGLTLTRGTMTVFASPIYEADLMKQGLARIYRGSQDKVTNTVFIEALNTVERAVYERLNGKYERMQDLLDLMKQQRKGK